MKFTIDKIILWPKNSQKQIRQIKFDSSKVNIITGGSEKGKSAIISILDYCLASTECKIPRRIIREFTGWFGVLINLDNNNQLLLVRQEPGADRVSNDMYMKFGSNLMIPISVQANCTSDDVKHRLNDLAQLPYIDFEKSNDIGGFQARPSFRDMVSFIFQPQYIIANQSSLYYKSDSSKHREKIKTIFPYILKAVDNEYLQLKEELREKSRELLALQKELEKRKKNAEKWLGEIRANYITAKEFGLLNDYPYPNDDWEINKYLQFLRNIPNSFHGNLPMITIGATTISTDRLIDLQQKEIDTAFKIQNLRVRQELVKKIESSNREYRTNLVDQHIRLHSADWFNKKIKKSVVCPFCNAKNDSAKKYIEDLVKVNSEIIEKGATVNDHRAVLGDELLKVNKEINGLERDLNNIRSEFKALQTQSKDQENRMHSISSVYKFIGQLEVELKNYDAQLNNSDLTNQINLIRERINIIEDKIKKTVIERRLARAKRKIGKIIYEYAKIFKASNYEDQIELNIKDLTLDFIGKDNRHEVLYEIGSGSNYMAYHISTLLALHEYFLQFTKHPIPNFIIFDQPSQAYFPDIDIENIEKNEDIDRVKKIFEALQLAVTRTNGKLQIIVLEHVGKYAWDNLSNMKMIHRWREGEDDNALIPLDWQI